MRVFGGRSGGRRVRLVPTFLHSVTSNVLKLSNEDLLASIMQWYEAHMKEVFSCTVAVIGAMSLPIDGNAKLCRHT